MHLLMWVDFASERALEVNQGLTVAEWWRGVGLAATVAAIVALVLVEFVYRKQLERATYHWLLLIGLLVLPSVALMGTTTVLFDESKTVESCATCHVMHPFVNDLRNPASDTLSARHYRNKWIPDQACYSCHTTYGVHGTLAAKRDGFRHWLVYVTGTWEEPIRYKGTYPNSNCLFCHADTPKFDAIEMHEALDAELAGDQVACIACHGPPHPLRDERDPQEMNP